MNCSTVFFIDCKSKPLEILCRSQVSELFEQVRRLNYKQSESRKTWSVSGLLINSAGNEVATSQKLLT